MEKIHLKYYNEQEYRDPVELEYGPSWNILWLGGVYPFLKKDPSRGLIIILLHICVTILSFCIAPVNLAIIIAILFVFFINILFAFNYNMIVIEGFIRAGYLPMDTQTSEKLIKKGIYFKLQ